MRVLVAADAMAGLGSRGASEVIATAFADAGAEVAVVPLADGGAGLAEAVGEMDPGGSLVRPDSIAELVQVLSTEGGGVHEGKRLRIDLTGVSRHDWDELTRVDGRAVADSMRHQPQPVVAIVSAGEQSATLTGLSGRVAERGREDGEALAETLAANDAVSTWLDVVGVDGAAPGSGAADGIGAIMLALGARVMSGIEALIEGFDVERTAAMADLLVTGTSVLDFHAVGGHVVKEVARMGTDASRPVIAIVGRNFVSSRELRVAGIESAHAILDAVAEEEPLPAQLAEVAGRVAKSWSW